MNEDLMERLGEEKKKEIRKKKKPQGKDIMACPIT